MVQKEFSKTTPPAARASRFGVSKKGSLKPRACQCCWSEKMNRILGLGDESPFRPLNRPAPIGVEMAAKVPAPPKAVLIKFFLVVLF